MRIFITGMEEHYYDLDHRHLLDPGYKPSHDVEKELEVMLGDLMRHRDRIEARREALTPDIRWEGKRQKVRFL